MLSRQSCNQGNFDSPSRRCPFGRTHARGWQSLKNFAIQIRYQGEAIMDWSEAYGRASPEARKAFKEAIAPAMNAFNEAIAPAMKAFNEAIAPAQQAFEEDPAVVAARAALIASVEKAAHA